MLQFGGSALSRWLSSDFTCTALYQPFWSQNLASPSRCNSETARHKRLLMSLVLLCTDDQASVVEASQLGYYFLAGEGFAIVIYPVRVIVVRRS
jgi:hypothetical protein